MSNPREARAARGARVILCQIPGDQGAEISQSLARGDTFGHPCPSRGEIALDQAQDSECDHGRREDRMAHACGVHRPRSGAIPFDSIHFAGLAQHQLPPHLAVLPTYASATTTVAHIWERKRMFEPESCLPCVPL